MALLTLALTGEERGPLGAPRGLLQQRVPTPRLLAPKSRYNEGVDVLDLCAAADFPPCLMLRRMLEHMLGLSKQVRPFKIQKRRGLSPRRLADGAGVHATTTLTHHGVTSKPCHPPPRGATPCCKQRVSDVLKDPSLLDAHFSASVDAASTSGAALWERLRADVVRCQRADRAYSHYSDMAKTLAGELLSGTMALHGMHFA